MTIRQHKREAEYWRIRAIRWYNSPNVVIRDFAGGARANHEFHCQQIERLAKKAKQTLQLTDAKI